MDDIISKKGEVVGSWNGESVEDLKKTLLKLRQELRAKGDKVEHTGIPHQDQFPDDLKEFTAYILWGCDKNNVCLVGSGANRTESVDFKHFRIVIIVLYPHFSCKIFGILK